jgi:hypothetical protein
MGSMPSYFNRGGIPDKPQLVEDMIQNEITFEIWGTLGITEFGFKKDGVPTFNPEDCYQSRYSNNWVLASEDKTIYMEDFTDMTYMF